MIQLGTTTDDETTDRSTITLDRIQTAVREAIRESDRDPPARRAPPDRRGGGGGRLLSAWAIVSSLAIGIAVGYLLRGRYRSMDDLRSAAGDRVDVGGGDLGERTKRVSERAAAVVTEGARRAGESTKRVGESVGEEIEDRGETVGEEIEDRGETVGEEIEDRGDAMAEEESATEDAEGSEDGEEAERSDTPSQSGG